jgi:hypothetical protein
MAAAADAVASAASLDHGLELGNARIHTVDLQRGAGCNVRVDNVREQAVSPCAVGLIGEFGRVEVETEVFLIVLLIKSDNTQTRKLMRE